MLIVGLGNLGANYSQTRHNVGFMAVDAISDRHNFTWNRKSKFNSDIAIEKIDFKNASKNLSKQLILCKPTTFMNLVDEAITPLKSFYKIAADDIVVIHDDLDIPVGKIKYKIGGGPGGHNGLKSIDNGSVGTNYHRIRVGIGRPSHTNYDISDYVLGKFTDQEQPLINSCLDFIVDNLELILAKDFKQFKTILNESDFK